ncbi:MAG: sigma-70 family RNA polymerase sigma factor [Bacteroidetes Order II. Incertae sedis bacterium]|nr:sigma-70 family RNA polymerase sigma factor [Bacteroidetes Order II. bacterium]
MTWSDEELVAAYLEKGDERAFGLLLSRHQERVFSYLMGMVKDVNIANDLFQDTFLRVISALQERRGSYQQQGRFIYWVIRIARNTTLDYLRTRKKWKDVADPDDDENNFWDRLSDDAPNAVELMLNQEQREWLEACIAQLPPEQREVLLMRHETGLSFKEIAALTDCSINTALGRMRYALLNLQKIMKRMGKPELVDLHE